jgi:hypothetical protein
MSDRRCRLAAVFAVFALLGCGWDAARGPVPEYPFAYATNECGPADGPAMNLYLSDRALDSLPPVAGHLLVMLWVGREEAVGKTYRSTDQPLRGVALECSSRTPCDNLASWRVTLRGFARDTLDGSVDLRLGQRVVAGSFRARWTTKQRLCG